MTGRASIAVIHGGARQQPRSGRGDIRPAIILPTYNNARTLPDICRRCEALKLTMIIVNDGSTDGTAAWLARREISQRGAETVIVTHPKNRGKAEALRSGFAAAIQNDCTHAITIDTDGQLDPECIPALLDCARRNPRALIVGARDDRQSDYPTRSRVGRKLSNFAIRLECEAIVADSQCGLRVYPLDLIKRVPCRTGRYGFEAAIITLAAWNGFPILNVPVNCRYLTDAAGGVSHFRPFRDSLHGVLLHAHLLLMKLVRPLRIEPTPVVHAPAREAITQAS
jgi:glycosyltransferase involved in cell wall biosynthesis